MNCECFYVIKEGTVEAAREFVTKAKEWRDKQTCCELYPGYISKAKKDFYACSDYDSFTVPFKVKKDSILVFVEGKYHLMCEMQLKGATRGFPDRSRQDQLDFDSNFERYIEDIEEV